MKDPETINNVVFFDGECVMCNRFLHFLVRKDRNKILNFSTLQSDAAKKFLFEKKLNLEQLDSVVYYSEGQVYIESDAGLQILRKLPFPYKLAFGFYIVPRWIRNPIYRWIAKRRYRIWGTQACMMPTPEIKNRFVFMNSSG